MLFKFVSHVHCFSSCISSWYSATEAEPERGLISLKNPKAGDTEPPKEFYFDAVFGPNVEQKYLYEICASSVVESVLNGYNGTIFAYGQVSLSPDWANLFWIHLHSPFPSFSPDWIG